jgi:hypothetical protein
MQYTGIVLALALVACSSGERAQQPGSEPVTISLAEFKQLHWIAGTWRGSGGAYPAFFEEYRVLNDSTILMRGFSDSTFSVTTDSSGIEWRNGTIRSGAQRDYVAVDFSATSIRFARPGVPLGGHTFARNSDDEWTATLHASRPDGQVTVYRMRRVSR